MRVIALWRRSAGDDIGMTSNPSPPRLHLPTRWRRQNFLEGEMPQAQRQHAFVANIQSESARLQQLIERLLHLAQVEPASDLGRACSRALAPAVVAG